MWRRMEKISRLHIPVVTDEEVLRRVTDLGKLLNSIWQRKHWWMAAFYIKLLKVEWQVNQQGEEELICYVNWQMMTPMLHSYEQQRTPRLSWKMAIKQVTSSSSFSNISVTHYKCTCALRVCQTDIFSRKSPCFVVVSSVLHRNPSASGGGRLFSTGPCCRICYIGL